MVVRTLTEEVKAKKSILVFLAKTKARINQMKSIQRKLSLTQGIIVPSDGQSGGLVMVWREGGCETEELFKFPHWRGGL